MIFRADGVREFKKTNLNFPSNILPIVARQSKFQRLGAFPAVAFSDADRKNAGIFKRKDQVPWGNLPHGFVEWISSTIRISFGRPKIAANDFMAIGLILINPPKSHSLNGMLVICRQIAVKNIRVYLFAAKLFIGCQIILA